MGSWLSHKPDVERSLRLLPPPSLGLRVLIFLEGVLEVPWLPWSLPHNPGQGFGYRCGVQARPSSLP